MTASKKSEKTYAAKCIEMLKYIQLSAAMSFLGNLNPRFLSPYEVGNKE
jgi:hypothetical protein